MYKTTHSQNIRKTSEQFSARKKKKKKWPNY